MKKVLLVLLCVVMLFTFTACNNNPFLSKSKVDSLVKQAGGANPQAEMTIEYKVTKGSKTNEYKIVLTYEILLDKTPITALNFIDAVVDNYYSNLLFDYNSSAYNYFIGGRYYAKQVEVEGNETNTTVTKYYKTTARPTFVGEFEGNNYSDPTGATDGSGYSKFEALSLAMYHDKNTESFDKANGAIIMALRDDCLNYKNYAVFAKMVNMVVYVDGVASPQASPENPSTEPLDWLLTNLKSYTSTNTQVVYDVDGNELPQKQTFLTVKPCFSIKMLGNTDWAKLTSAIK